LCRGLKLSFQAIKRGLLCNRKLLNKISQWIDLQPLETCTESYIAFQSPLSSISQKQTVVSISTKSMPDGSSKLDEDLQTNTGNLWVDKNNHVNNAMHEHVYHERTVSQQ
jgi:hypothetical protein